MTIIEEKNGVTFNLKIYGHNFDAAMEKLENITLMLKEIKKNTALTGTSQLTINLTKE